jgi:hypothetical protein
MKKIFLAICLTLALLLPSNLNGQTPVTVNVHGGYSWINGVVGGEAQFGNFGVSSGWMPTSMPMSGEKVNSVGFGLTYYSLKAGEPGYSGYLTLGFASDGYRYEDSWGGDATVPVTIIMLGSKYDSGGGFYSKAGIGYGWCTDPDVGTFAFEVLLGFTLFGSK